MDEFYVVPPGVRVVRAPDGLLLLVPPALGFALRPLAVGPAAVAALRRLREPVSREAALATLAAAGATPALLDECLHHGIVRRHREALDTGRLAEEDAGFLLFALGDPRYGRLAVNAARTIAAAAPGAKVALCHDDTAVAGLGAAALAVFDRHLECPREVCTPAGRLQPLWAKLHADLLAPYSRTVVVDADAAFFAAPSRLADELLRYTDCDFAPTCSFTHLPAGVRAQDRVIVWADALECIQRFAIRRPLYQTHLYYFGFGRTPAAARLFATAREVYRALEAEPLRSMRRWYGGRVSAELAMSIATGLCDFRLYSASHLPMTTNRMPWRADAARHHLGFVFCGRPPDAAWRLRYDELVAAATPPGEPPPSWRETVA